VAQDVNLSVSAVSKALADDPAIPEQTKRRGREASRRLAHQPRRSRTASRRTSDLQQLALILVGTGRSGQSITGSLADVCVELNLIVKLQVLVVQNDEPTDLDQTLAEVAEGNDGLILAGRVTSKVIRHVAALGVPYVTM